MVIDERLVEILLEADEQLEGGRAVAFEHLCPGSPELWPALRELLDGLGRVDRLMSPVEECADSSEQPPDDASIARALDATLSPGIAPNIGRYRLIRLLGQGGFGNVYLAHDDELDRSVAIKVPHPDRIIGHGDVGAYLAEARTLAKLDHPNILPVYDAGRTEDGLCYVVSKYISGSNLAERLKQGRPSFRESAEIVALVAEALHHAHARDLVHRDIKPANILVDIQGKPWVADLGLALTEADFGKGVRLAGTPAYMSPEQARGEGHRVDGRSDIFSLGVVLYELLTGRRPFRGKSHQGVMEQITAAEPRPPRQIDDTIPRELERICQKAMAKRTPERYGTARDMAEDLRDFLETEAASGASLSTPSTVSFPPRSTPEATPFPPSSGRPDSSQQGVKIVPKSLRSFDQHDAEFFLELLPGPRDRDGLPESLRFWKTRIESTDSDATFKVGLIYGPSGCGQSSLVKAGLLPRLAKHVLSVYVEATAAETERRLLKAVRKTCPELPLGMGLVDGLAALRRGRLLRPGQKVLLVLDHFEQWLFARRGEENPELVAALRQCDGEHVQAIVTVRDDLWMAATRFMKELEILPQAGADIKGQMRSVAELGDASGYAGRSGDFDDLVHILDHDLRLITPTDPEGLTGEGQPAGLEGERSYQLTHDDLVHSLRDWLTRKQRETRRGRAELRLIERAALWNARPENRLLPSLWQWANIRLRTKKSEWTEPQRRMMRRAEQVNGLRALGLAILIALATWGVIEGYGNLRAAVALSRLGHAREVWPLLRYSADPWLRSYLINWLSPLGTDPGLVAAEFTRIDSNAPAWRGSPGTPEAPAPGPQVSLPPCHNSNSWTPSCSTPRPR